MLVSLSTFKGSSDGKASSLTRALYIIYVYLYSIYLAFCRCLCASTKDEVSHTIREGVEYEGIP